ncbi:MAG: hypothetical protein HC806_02835, partial [Anaerolineae bacterium]|nr:hypothetical protein [Anaerolineae bacterium]
GPKIRIGILIFFALGVIIPGCQTDPPSPAPIIETVVVTQEIPRETVIVPVTITPPPSPLPDPSPIPDNELIICMGQEPESLYLYNGGADISAASSVLQAIYDGPIDHLSYGVQPVILEKIPTLADGDAIFQEVEVAVGDPIVDIGGKSHHTEIGCFHFPFRLFN